MAREVYKTYTVVSQEFRPSNTDVVKFIFLILDGRLLKILTPE
jgi:hypothetical protein